MHPDWYLCEIAVWYCHRSLSFKQSTVADVFWVVENLGRFVTLKVANPWKLTDPYFSIMLKDIQKSFGKVRSVS
jgi:hypothetical protein